MPKSPTDWMKLLLSTGEYADVHFLVGDGDEKELVPAHKLILKNASDVFEAMFRFDSKNANSENDSANCPVVEVSDVEATAFKVMLSFIYAGDLSGLNGDNAMAVLYAAKKYNIPDLVDPSLQIPVSKLRNVFLAFAQARLFDLEDFANCCLSYIDKNADTLLKSDEFLQIDQKMLSEILERDELQTRGEISIWNAVLTAEEKFGVYQFFCQPHFNPVKFPSHWRSLTFGTISMDIEKVSELERHPMGSYRFSDDTVYIKGLSWKILAQINQRTEGTDNEKYLAIFLWCNGPSEDLNWSCKCSAKVQIISQKNGAENSIGTFYDHVFNNKLQDRGFNFEFVELMEPSNGFYDQNGDKITVTIDFAVSEPKADKSISDSSKSYGTLSMDIEKVSEFAREVVFSERRSESVTYINGFPWKIWAQISQRTESTDNNEKCLGIFLFCAALQEDINWSLKCSATFRIVSQKCGVTDIEREFSEERTFNSESITRGIADFISFAELMDPEKEKWSCKCSAIIRIVSQKCDVADFRRELNDDVFDNKNGGWGYNCISLVELMDPSKGFYDKGEDKCDVADFRRELNDDVFDNKNGGWGYNCISLVELMDPSKGFYDKGEDNVTLKTLN
ncbi:hypothetical protein niasHT_036796 [Heterodera trifolii]|uniref:BTB domain-containing protein n=1 Tax=Heterodera trifolii TaxID=157864 RepID=A0ABD2IVL0_9BILA